VALTHTGPLESAAAYPDPDSPVGRSVAAGGKCLASTEPGPADARAVAASHKCACPPNGVYAAVRLRV
jgi:hypothetical protein